MKKAALHILILVASIAWSHSGMANTSRFPGAVYHPERIWLVVSRTLCIPGEEIDFHLEVLVGDLSAPSLLSTSVRLEFTDPQGKPIIRKNLLLDKGRVSGKLLLPDEVPSGWYYLRAYTAWMMNGPAEEYAVLPIRLIKPTDTEIPLTLPDSAVKGNDQSAAPIVIRLADPAVGLRAQVSLNADLPDASVLASSAQIMAIPAELSDLQLCTLSGPIQESSGFSESGAPHHLPQTRPGILAGKVSAGTPDSGVPGCLIGLTDLETRRFDVAVTDSLGRFLFDLTEDRDYVDFILTFITKPDSLLKIETANPYDTREWHPAERKLTLTPDEQKYILTRDLHLRISRIYAREDEESAATPARPAPVRTFFHPPDRIVRTDDFIELANVREVVYEVVPDVTIRTNGKEPSLGLYSPVPWAADYPFLTLLDGIPLYDHSALLALPSDRIRLIEVKNQVYLHGPAVFSGIVSFSSRNDDFAGLSLPSGSVQGRLLMPEQGSHPQDTPSLLPPPNIPVLDPVLHFRPINGNSATLQTNDRPGDYRIIVIGLTREGKIIRGEWRLLVTG